MAKDSRQQQPIPFLDAQQSGLEELGGASPIAMNVIVRGSTVQRRPGLGAYPGALSDAIDPDGITAIRKVANGDLYVVAGDSPTRHIYLVTAGGSVDLSSANPETDLRGTTRPTIAETESILAITGGNRVQKVVLSTKAVSPLANAPQGSHVVAHQSRLLIDNPELQTEVDISGLASGPDDYSGLETWSGITAGVIQAIAKPSQIQNIGENSNEIFLFTKLGMQVFAPDALAIYTTSSAQEIGCAAPFSVIRSDESMALLDHHRRFIMTDGRNVVPLSTGLQQTLNDLTTVSDCFGYRYLEGDTDALVWTFPTDGRTFVYQKGAGWGEWSTWDSVSNNWAPWGVLCHHLVSGEGVNLVGTDDGQLLELSTRNTTDLGDAIPAHVTTGFINRGTENRKTCRGVSLTLRGGDTTDSLEVVGLLSWRDDLGPFGPPLEVGLPDTGESDVVIRFRSLGYYRRRQWRFTFTGTSSLSLVAVTEEFEVQAN